MTDSKNPWAGQWIKLYSAVIGYRFRDRLRKPLEPPNIPDYLNQLGRDEAEADKKKDEIRRFVEEVQGKARASLTTSGVLLGFSVAVLAALIGSKETREELFCALHSIERWKLLMCASGSLLVFGPKLDPTFSDCSQHKLRKVTE